MSNPVVFESTFLNNMKAEYFSIQKEVQSMEGFLDGLKRMIPNTIKNFLGFSKSLTVNKHSVKALDRKTVNIIQSKIIAVSYMDLDHDTAMIPAYFTGTYLQYAELLLKFAQYCSKLQQHIDQYERSLALILSDPKGNLKDFSKEISEYSQWRAEREGLKQDLAALFTSKSTSDIAPYGQVIKRQSEWDDVIKTMESVSIIINRIDVKDIKDSITHLSNLLTEIKKLIDQGNLDESNKDIGKQIGMGALEIAEQIEFYSLLRFQYDILYNCIIETVDKL